MTWGGETPTRDGTVGCDSAASRGGRVAAGFIGVIPEMWSADSTAMNKIMRIDRRFMVVSETNHRFAAHTNMNGESPTGTTFITPNSWSARIAFHARRDGNRAYWDLRARSD